MQNHLQKSCYYASYKETDLIRNIFADQKWHKMAKIARIDLIQWLRFK